MRNEKSSLICLLLAGLAAFVGYRQSAVARKSPEHAARPPSTRTWRNLYPALQSVFVTSDGKRLWVAGARGTILASVDGEHWKPQVSDSPMLSLVPQRRHGIHLGGPAGGKVCCKQCGACE
jgi:photosystem II stability/assembly factor-like uncharacterized protein